MMSRLPLLAVSLGLFAAGCSDSTPTTPGPATPQNRFVYTATMSPANEVPAITNAESTGTGRAPLPINTTRDAPNQITAATVDVSATFTGFPPGTVITLAHIHT